jgi:hypothetical protein
LLNIFFVASLQTANRFRPSENFSAPVACGSSPQPAQKRRGPGAPARAIRPSPLIFVEKFCRFAPSRQRLSPERKFQCSCCLRLFAPARAKAARSGGPGSGDSALAAHLRGEVLSLRSKPLTAFARAKISVLLLLAALHPSPRKSGAVREPRLGRFGPRRSFSWRSFVASLREGISIGGQRVRQLQQLHTCKMQPACSPTPAKRARAGDRRVHPDAQKTGRAVHPAYIPTRKKTARAVHPACSPTRAKTGARAGDPRQCRQHACRTPHFSPVTRKDACRGLRACFGRYGLGTALIDAAARMIYRQWRGGTKVS